MKFRSITVPRLFTLLLLVLPVAAVGGDRGHRDHRDHRGGHDGCFNVRIPFVLTATAAADGSVVLTGPVRGGLFNKATLDLVARPEHIVPTVGGLVPDSTVAALAIGGYTLRNGDQLFVEVLAISDFATNSTVGLQTITGGTGYFEGASGVLRGTGVLDGNTRNSEVKGSICLGE